MTLVTNLTTSCLVLVPTVTACAITDIAGNVDAGSVGGASGASNPLDASAGMGGSAALDASAGMGGSATPLDASVRIGGTGATTSTSLQVPDCSGTAPTPLPTWSTPDGCVTGNESAQFVGVWEGYIQGTSIGDESSTFRLNILGANSSGLCGTVTVGTHTAPVTLPPVTDPNGPYPPNSILPSTLAMNNEYEPILGLAYTIQDGRIDGQHATFSFAYKEVFRALFIETDQRTA